MTPAMLFPSLMNNKGESIYTSPPRSRSASAFNTSSSVILFLILILFSEKIGFAQELRYRVVRNGDSIGTILLNKALKANATIYSIRSHVSTSIVFTVRVSTQEESRFERGMLMYSVVNRSINGKQSGKKETIWNNGEYGLLNDGKRIKSTLKEPVRYNFIQLYYEEPLQRDKVYSDNQHDWATITRTGKGVYKIQLPDGNTNEFHYLNGKCVKVDINHRFYNFSFILINPAAVYGGSVQ